MYLKGKYASSSLPFILITSQETDYESVRCIFPNFYNVVIYTLKRLIN